MRKQPQLLKVITDIEVEQIHEASLRILSEVGVSFPYGPVRERLAAIGADVDQDREVVTFRPEVVLKAVQGLPKDFTIAAADGGPPVRFGDGRLKLSFDQTPDIVDYIANQSSRRDCSEVLRGIAVANALDNVRLATGYCLPNDVPDRAGDIVSFQLLWTYSKKAVANWIYSPTSARAIIEMALVVAGSAERLKRDKLLTYFAEPISPLRWSRHSLEIMELMAEYECPIYLGPMVTMGGSGPVTIAGALALHNAEILHGLVTIYALNPRQPVVYSCHAHRLDMSRGSIMYGAPEQGLLAAGATQLAQRYGLAAADNVMLSDSNCPDYMAGFEAAATAAYALAAGWEMLGFCGFGTIGIVGAGVGGSLEHAVIQDEALGYLERMVRSFEVNDETLALEVIKAVGIGGNFLDQEHTVKHLRGELWQDRGIFKASDYETWLGQGAATVLDRAHERVQKIIERDLPLRPVLSVEKAEEVKRIAQAYIAGS